MKAWKCVVGTRNSVYNSKTINKESSLHLINIIPKRLLKEFMQLSQCWEQRKNILIPYFHPSFISQWDNLDINIRNTEFLALFKSNLLKLIRPISIPIYNKHNPKGIHLLTRLRLWLSHLRDLKFKHILLDIANPLCTCSLESTAYFFSTAMTALL